MTNLNNKYRNDLLTSEELKQWKQQVVQMDNQEMEDMMVSSWNDDVDVSHIEDDIVQKIKKRVDISLGTDMKTKQTLKVMRLALIAASLIIPVLIISSYYLYHEGIQAFDSVIKVATIHGEQAMVVLPDNSLVKLNHNSVLSYNLKDFDRQERNIIFEGEGHFQVAKIPNCTFNIHTDQLNVKVLGTTFNFNVRKNRNTAMIALEEGLLKLTSLKLMQEVYVHPGELATLDYATGKIKVTKQYVAKGIQAWQTNRLVCNAKSIDDVLKELEDAYRVRFIT